MEYIEKRYTEPNEDGVIGLVFEPVEKEEEQPAEETTEKTTAAKKKAAKA